VKSHSQALGITVAGFDTANGFRFSGSLRPARN
jgi:hypothetical protein